MKHRKKWTVLLAFATCLALTGAGAQAIDDEAEIFSTDARERADELLAELRQATGIEIVIETVADIGDVSSGRYALDRAVERRVYGAYVLIALDVKNVEVKVAGSLKEVLTPEWVSENRESMAAAFKENDFDEGLLDFVETAAEDLKDARVEPPPKPAPGAVRPALSVAGANLVFVLVLLVLGLAMTGRVVLPLLSFLRKRAA